MLRFAFLAAAAVLWSSVFGYVALLVATAARRRSLRSHRGSPSIEAAGAGDAGSALPDLAVVIPVRNEQRFIAGKLANLRKADYPAERLAIVVVDGGSSDDTATLVEAARRNGDPVTLVRVRDARGRADQLNAVLSSLTQKILVVTDADAELDPGCLRALVETLQKHPATDVVGARVRPATRLIEERIHWWLLNSLWWLEGEALGNGQVSGVCYALRSSAVHTLPRDCTADDIRFGLLASARGRDVRLCRHALAIELRVPQTMRDFLTFRRRRGTGYLLELRRTRPSAAPLRWHLVQALRLYHFFVMPLLAAVVVAMALALLATPHWHWPMATGIAFVVPALVALFASTTLGEDRRWWRLAAAGGTMAGLTWFSLLVLPRAAVARILGRTPATPLAKGD